MTKKHFIALAKIISQLPSTLRDMVAAQVALVCTQTNANFDGLRFMAACTDGHPLYFANYVRAQNDRNGNPRRGWQVFDGTGETIAFVWEGYRGESALTDHFPNVRVLATYCVSPTELKAIAATAPRIMGG